MLLPTTTIPSPLGRKTLLMLVYQGIDLSRFETNVEVRHAAREENPIPSEAPPILGCIRRKGQMMLLQALVRVRAALPKAHLLLVGDGPDEGKLRRAVDEMSLGGFVTFVPFTSNPEEILALLDMLVVPSLYKEGLPNVILESMAIPVVSSRLAGIPEAVRDGETGVLVSPGDISGIASAIVELWRDRDTYAQMRDRALYLIRSVFDCKSKLEQYLRFLERMQIGKNVPMEGVTET